MNEVVNGILTADQLKIALSGRIDSVNAREVEEAIMKLVADAADRQIVLDLEQLSYISSAGS